MTKFKECIKRNKYSFLSFGIVSLFLLIIYAINGIAPFGTNTIMKSDAWHQYVPLLSQLYDKLSSGGSLIYSFSIGNGINAIGNILNYLMSPLTWLIMAFGKQNIYLMFCLVIVLKASLSAYTFSYFIRKREGTSDIYSVVVSILYALSAYFIAYYWNIMWLDALYMLPLVCVGIHKLIKDKNAVPYILALSYTIITSYYMGYMVCIASVIFFIFDYFTTHSIKDKIHPIENNGKLKEKNKFIDRGLYFAISSIIAAGISCVVLVPMISSLSTTSTISDSSITGLSFTSILDVLSNHLYYTNIAFYTGQYIDVVLPNIYCGILTLIAVPLYFCSKDYSKKNKVITGSVIAFFLLSFCCNVLNFIWHAGHFPNSLPYRFSYIYIFFILYIAYKGLISIKNISKKAILITTGAGILLTILLSVISAPYKTSSTLVLSVVLFVVYGICLLIISKKRTMLKNIVVLCLVLVELFLPYRYTIETIDSKEIYKNQNIADEIKNIAKENNDIFYKADMTDSKQSMPGALYGYSSVSVFSSINYANASALKSYLGANANVINYTYFQPQTPIFNMLMSVDYVANNSKEFDLNNDDYTFLYNKDGVDYYKSNYKTSIAFGSKTDLKDIYTSELSPFVVQNRFSNYLTGTDFSPMKIVKNTTFDGDGIDIKTEETNAGYFVTYSTNHADENSKIVIETTIDEDGIYYLTYPGMQHLSCTTTFNGRNIGRYMQTYPGTLLIGEAKKGDVIRTEMKYTGNNVEDKNFCYYISTYDRSDMDKLYESIKENGIATVEEFKDDYVKFTINNTTDYIYTSIPIDSNWEITIDGKPATSEQISSVSNAYYQLNLSAGTHTVEFKYHQKSISTGMMISVVSVCAFIVLIIFQKKKKKVFVIY